MTYGIVNKIIPFSAVDGPGNRTVVFLQSCNFQCLNCHNPETISFCSHCGICIDFCNSDALKIIDNVVIWNKNNCTSCDECIKNCPTNSSPKTTQFSVDELLNKIEKYSVFTSGITISGGECTVQSDFLLEFLKKAKQKGISAFIDSNLHVETEKLKELANYFDKAMPDVKSYNLEKHKLLTGQSSNLVLKNLNFLLKSDKVFEIRTVIIPNILNNEETISEVSKIIAIHNPKLRYKLIKYRKTGVKTPDFANEPSDELMQKLKIIAQNNGCENILIV
ncbi:MAG: YjjW family glycine radical enzyme activase [Bacteroidales bacterium]|nr:YjjW family glycine radical enzyme activase [Bacteroidales bacterium]